MNAIPAGLPVYREGTHELLGYLDMESEYDDIVFPVTPRLRIGRGFDGALQDSPPLQRVTLRLIRWSDNQRVIDAWLMNGSDESIATVLLTGRVFRPTSQMKAILAAATDPYNRDCVKRKITPPKPETEPAMPEVDAPKTRTRQEHLE